MYNITLSSHSLIALINVYKSSVELYELLSSNAIDAPKEGGEIWDETLDLEGLQDCYSELTKTIEQAKPFIASINSVINTSSPSDTYETSQLTLNILIHGEENDDLLLALEQVSLLVGDGYTSGHNRNENGAYEFDVK